MILAHSQDTQERWHERAQIHPGVFLLSYQDKALGFQSYIEIVGRFHIGSPKIVLIHIIGKVTLLPCLCPRQVLRF